MEIREEKFLNKNLLKMKRIEAEIKEQEDLRKYGTGEK